MANGNRERVVRHHVEKQPLSVAWMVTERDSGLLLKLEKTLKTLGS